MIERTYDSALMAIVSNQKGVLLKCQKAEVVAFTSVLTASIGVSECTYGFNLSEPDREQTIAHAKHLL